MGTILEFFGTYQGEIISLIAGAAGVKGIPAGWRGFLRVSRRFARGYADLVEAIMEAGKSKPDVKSGGGTRS